MSIATPPPPSALDIRPRPERIERRPARDWLPVLGWFIEDGLRHTRINVIPMANTVNPREQFVTTLKFIRGGEQPIHTFTSEPFAGDVNFRYEGRMLLDAIGHTSFEGLVEITARSLDNGPNEFPWVESWLEFFADDGSLNGSVPGFVFKGGTTKQVMSGKWQHWPGVAASDQYDTSVLLLNYHPRSLPIRLDLFAPSGRPAQSTTLEIPARMPGRFALEDHVPGARELLSREAGFGSLRIWSAYKLPGFVLIRNRQTGVITSFDHTVPFAGPPLD